jgi:hypothetical protein
MRTFDDPSAGAIARELFVHIGLFASTGDVSCPSELADQVAHFGVVVSFVQAQVDISFFWFRGLDGGEGRFEQFHIVAVGSTDHDRKRDATPVNK